MLQSKKGFTLIELLIVVVIIGILAAIAIPKFASTKEKAYITAMKSDLKNFTTAQEAYFSDYNSYGTFANVKAAGLFTGTSSVTVASTDGDATGFSASATHASTKKTCSVAVGAKVAAGAPEGEVTCK